MAEQPSDGFNAVNRGVYIADNLDFLRSLNSATIDLVYIDPPFAKNETWEADKLRPPLTRSERAIERRLLRSWGIRSEARAREAGIEWPDESTRFSDIWTWEQSVHEEWLLSLEESHPAIKELVEAAEITHSESMAAYLCYMAIRLIELKRVLKPTGSIYLHCDPTAGHYLKGLMDAIFGEQNFRNEIVWRIGWVSGFKTQRRGWIRNHDTILYYVASRAATSRFNKEYIPYPEGYVRRDGKPPTGRGIPIEDTWNSSAGDVLDSIMIKSFSTEKTGYPTQKPVSLLERIIRASSNEGDVVLDCFAGCATAALAAEKLQRRWVACDFNLRAWTVFKRQFSRPELTLRCNDETTGQQVLGTEPVVTIHGPGELPTRTSPETPPRRGWSCRSASSKCRPASSPHGRCWKHCWRCPTTRPGAAASPTAARTAPSCEPRTTSTWITSTRAQRRARTRSPTARRSVRRTTCAKARARSGCASTARRSPPPASCW